MHHEHGRTGGKTAAGLVQGVVFPPDVLHCMGDGTTALLVQQGHPVGKSQDVYPVLFPKAAAVGNACLYQEGMACVHRR